MKTRTLRTITLQGTIVSHEIKTPKAKTRTVMRYNKLAGKKVPTEVTHHPEDYAVLKIKSAKTGNVHRCVSWDVRDLSKRPIAWANVGDQVKITGPSEVVQITREDGSTFDLHQIVIADYKVLRKQPRHYAA